MHEEHRLPPLAAATLGSWVTWFVMHLTEINQFLQFLVLLVGLATGVRAMWMWGRKRDAE